MSKQGRGVYLRVAALLLVAGITVFIVVNREQVAQFAAWGYPGIFLVALVGSATIIFPVPHLALIFALGAVFNPWCVGLAAGLGDTGGELTGYLAGYALDDVLERGKLYARFERWMTNYGDLTLFVLALIPNPFFDLASIIGGLAGFPLPRFLLATWLGKTLKAVGIAWAGYYGVSELAQLLAE
ncbi:MAG TPA: VTT domain-containing protein [Thermoflexia bacterium]|nr:VTT domain-containing protein [Thermoflexia bacterium]